jgi:hypothetical protein
VAGFVIEGKNYTFCRTLAVVGGRSAALTEIDRTGWGFLSFPGSIPHAVPFT